MGFVIHWYESAMGLHVIPIWSPLPTRFLWVFPVYYFKFKENCAYYWASQVSRVVKNLPANAGHTEVSGWIIGSRRSPGGGNGPSLRYPCRKNPMDRGAWRAAVPGVAKRWTQLSGWATVIIMQSSWWLLGCKSHGIWIGTELKDYQQ